MTRGGAEERGRMSSCFTMEYPSPVGLLTLASDGQSITGLWIQGQKYFREKLPDPVPCVSLPVFQQAAAWLTRYFLGEAPEMTLPLAPEGSPFRRSVWDILLKIPYGQVTTYGAIARELSAAAGKSVCAQAVGGAVGHNPISILIPCHRVVGANGSLTGYASGIDRKIQLLTLEGAAMERLFAPSRGTAL